MTIPGNDESYLDILKKSAYPRERDVKVKTKKESITVRDKNGKVDIQVNNSDEKNMSYVGDTAPDEKGSDRQSERAGDVQPIAIVKNNKDEARYLNKKTIKPTKIKINISQDNKTPDPDNKVH